MGFGPRIPDFASQLSNGLRKKAAGTSASGVAGTVVATLSATAGSVFASLNILAGHILAANTQLRVTVTFTDDSALTKDSKSGEISIVFGNGGGATDEDGVHQSWSATLGIKKVEVTTLGTGTGTRWAFIDALEVLAS